ncbi:Tcc44h21-2.5 [Trypanosoma grayi]|uniref:Tcc44h21-2.5 n=1 Tax=Trypanosoma grayi TaxID=71804 RepID=UPI0004F413C3|nr:Tcc44h21-2.5 [Trypanosoma grayi]KEG15178.1 Tcc44h21-2.5 [Trypanosoma grayi]
MSLSSLEEACQHAVDVLIQVLGNEDLHAAARGMPYTDVRIHIAELSPIEEGLVLQGKLVRQQASMLLYQLGAGCSSDVKDGANKNTAARGKYNPPRFIDAPLFVRKSRLLRERARRVGITLSSLKHVGLLNEESLGRRVITDRAFGALRELLDMLVAVAATLAETPSPSDFRSYATSVETVADALQDSASRSSFQPTGCHCPIADVINGDAPENGFSVGPLHRHRDEITSEPSNPEAEQQKEKQGNNDHKTSRRSSSSERKKGPLLVEKARSPLPVLAYKATAPASTSASSEKTPSAALTSPLLRYEQRTLLAPHEASEADTECVGLLETGVLDSHKPLGEVCDDSTHFPACKQRQMPLSTAPQVPDRRLNTKASGNAGFSTRVTRHDRLFRGQLWRELLRGGEAAAAEWKDVFISEVGMLFGIPNEWVTNVHLVEDKAIGLTGGDQIVRFEVLLPSSLEKDDIALRIRQHEFTGMLLLYENLQERRDREQEEEVKTAGRQEEEDDMEERDGSAGSVTSQDVTFTTPLDFERTILPRGDTDSAIKDIDNKRDGDKGSPVDLLTSLSVTESLSRVALQAQENHKRSLFMTTSAKNRHMMERERLRPATLTEGSSPTRHHIEQWGARGDREDAGCCDDTTQLPARCFTLPNQQSVQLPPSLQDGGEKERPSSPSSSRSSSDSGNGGDSPALRSRTPPLFARKDLTSPQKMQKSPTMWLTTTHEKVIRGERWETVLVENEDSVRRTFATELTDLFELPEESVRNVEFAPGGLRVTFDLVHDRYLHESEINALLAVFDFPQVRSLYQRCLDCGNKSPYRLSDDTCGGDSVRNSGDIKVVDTDDAKNSSLAFSGAIDIDLQCSDPLDDNASMPKVEGSQQMPDHQPHFPLRVPTMVWDGTVTPDNEPVTLAHLSLLHDLPLNVLIEANPHLASFGVNEPLSLSASVAIPRGELEEDFMRLAEGSDALGSRSMTPSLTSPTPSRIHTLREAESSRAGPLMNLKSVAKKLGVSVQTLRQRNPHLDAYSDIELLPRNCSINIPALLFGAPESASGFSSVRSSPRALAAPAANPTASVVTCSRGTDAAVEPPRKTLLEELKQHHPRGLEQTAAANVQIFMGEQAPPHSLRPCPQNVMHTENGSVTTAKSPSSTSSPPPPRGSTSSGHSDTVQSLMHSDTRPPSVTTVSHPHPGRISTNLSDAVVGREQAVLVMERSQFQFLLIRFFAKWQYMAQMRRGMRQLVCVPAISAKGRLDLPEAPLNLHCRLRTLRTKGGQRPRHAVSPRMGVTPNQGTRLIAKTMEAIARTQSRTTSPRAESRRRPAAELASGRSRWQQQQQGSAKTRTSSANPPLRGVVSGRSAISPLRSSRSENRTLSQPPTAHSNTTRLGFSRASSTHSISRASSLDRRRKLRDESVMSEQLPLGLLLTSSLEVAEAVGEAAEAGIRRGDRLVEAGGNRLQTLKDFHAALAAAISPHLFVTVAKKSNGALTAYRVQRREWDDAGAPVNISPRASLAESKTAPVLTAAKSVALTALRVRSGSNNSSGRTVVPPPVPQRRSISSTPLSRDARGSYEARRLQKEPQQR